MKPKTEEFLNFLLWTGDKLCRPTFRNLTESYESWAYRDGLMRQLGALVSRELVEGDTRSSSDRLYRLTDKGRLHALGGRDPDAQWSRPWDGRWRLVLFDVPMARHVHRGRLRRYLRGRGFGCLQGSVWVTPDPVAGEREILADGKVNVNSLLLLEATPGAGETDDEIVTGAWDFVRVNQNYARHIEILDQRPEGPLDEIAAARRLQRWATQERAAWLAVIGMDPLLPKRLLPEDYLGCRAWRRRVEVMRQAGEQLVTFQS